MKLHTGDIILSHERGSQSSKQISFFTGCYYSHAALYVGGGNIIESLRVGVGFRDVYDELKRCDYIILRCPYILKEQKLMINAIAPSYIGKHYDFGATTNFLRGVMKGVGKYYEGNKDALMCSGLVVDIYKRIGINLCAKNNPIPKDILESPLLKRVY